MNITKPLYFPRVFSENKHNSDWIFFFLKHVSLIAHKLREYTISLFPLLSGIWITMYSRPSQVCSLNYNFVYIFFRARPFFFQLSQLQKKFTDKFSAHVCRSVISNLCSWYMKLLCKIKYKSLKKKKGTSQAYIVDHVLCLKKIFSIVIMKYLKISNYVAYV